MAELPRSLYVHIPFCKSKCIYCGFYSVPIEGWDPGRLLNAELKELANFRLQKPLETIYIGGGSPSCIGNDVLLQFLKNILATAGAAREFTVEINPAQAEEALLCQLRMLGVNRISIGAQSFNEGELKFLSRAHNVNDIEKTIRLAKQAGFENISLDLMFALPGATLNRWKDSLQKSLACEPQHISAYSLSYEPATCLERMKRSGKIVAINEQLDREMYEAAIGMLEEAGFEHYEISNFAKPGYRCVHNLAYWNDASYIGLGPAAGSHLGSERILNIRDIKQYIQAIDSNQSPAEFRQTLAPIETACEKAVLALRKIEGIDLAEFKTDTGLDPFALFGKTIEQGRKKGLLKIENNHLSLTKPALPIADTILCDFSSPD